MKQTVILIDKRVEHVVDFEYDESDVRSYVIESNGQSSQDLFRFHLGSGNQICLQENNPQATEVIARHDVELEPSELSESNLLKYVLTITLTNRKDSKTQKSNDVSTDKDLIIEDRHDYTDGQIKSVRLKRKNNGLTLQQTEVSVKFIYGQAVHEFVLFIVPAKKISDAVIDFGSEASQIALCNRNQIWTEASLTRVFRDMYKTVKGQDLQRQAATDYDQFDPGDERFYRSMFFAKTKVSKDEANANPFMPMIGEENGLLKVLTTGTESQELTNSPDSDYIMLPNIKLSRFGGISQPRINENIPLTLYRDNYYYRASLNHFVLNAIRTASEADDDISAMTIYVLLPNVYDQYAIFSSLKDLRTDLSEVIKSGKSGKIRHIEVASLSESDASLLGALSQIENIRNGNYLILDAGKGTLDYSVINVDNSRPDRYHSIYRGGIIGAGNTITTAYVVALLRDFVHLCGHKDITDDALLSLVIKNVLGISLSGPVHDGGAGDTAMLRKLVRAAENFKFAKNRKYQQMEKQPSEPKSVDRLDNLSLESFVEYVGEQVKDSTYFPLSPESEKFVTNAIENLCDDVMKDLNSVLPHLDSIVKDNDNSPVVDGVLFAGRGFRQIAFKNRLKQRLVESKLISGSNSELEYLNQHSSANDKNICLFVSPILNEGKYDGSRASLFRETHKQAQKKKDMIGSTNCRNVRKWFHKKWGKQDEENNDTDSYFIPLSENSSRAGAISERFMAEGVHVEIERATDRILIGGTKYNPNVTGEQTIFFTSKEIIARDNNGNTVKVKPNPVNLKTSPFVLSSLFPVVYKHISSDDDYNAMLNNLRYTIEHDRNNQVTQNEEKEHRQGMSDDKTKGEDIQKEPNKNEIAGSTDRPDLNAVTERLKKMLK